MFWVVVALSVNPFSCCLCRSPLDKQRVKLGLNIEDLLKITNYNEITDSKINLKFSNLYKSAMGLIPKNEEESGCCFLEQASSLALLGVVNNKLELMKLVFQFGYTIKDLTGYYEEPLPNKVSVRQLAFILNDKDLSLVTPLFTLDKPIASRFVELCLTSPFNVYATALDYFELLPLGKTPEVLELQIRLRLIYGNIPDDKLLDIFATHYQSIKWRNNDVDIVHIDQYTMPLKDSQNSLLLADLMFSNESVDEALCDFVVVSTLPGMNCILYEYLIEREYCEQSSFTKAKKLSNEWYNIFSC